MVTKYIVTYKLNKQNKTRKIAMRNGKIPMLKKSSAQKLAREYEGLNPRVRKMTW